VSGRRLHHFDAVAFEENLILRQLAALFPGAQVSPLEIYLPFDSDGGIYVYSFGAVAAHDVAAEQRDEVIARIRTAVPRLTTRVVREEYTVEEDPQRQIGIQGGRLCVDRLNPGRAAVVALTVAQSAAMEYYERIIEQMFGRTGAFVERLEERGGVPFRTRRLHRFIGQAITTRTEVLSVLHLLDKPDATWDDAAMDRIYADLRSEFDLADRYASLELKLRSIQEALELLLGVARDRQIWWLEVTVVVLIALELLLSLPWLK